MKTLVVEDDRGTRIVMRKFLSEYGEVELVANGQEALGAYRTALDMRQPYDLVCLDIRLPDGMDGHEVLKQLRGMEEEEGIHTSDKAKIIMTSALKDPEHVLGAFKSQAEAYLIKPVDKQNLKEKLTELGLL